MRYLAVDPGGRKMGLALADDATDVVTPLAVVPYGGAERGALAVAEQARRHQAQRIVIGLPERADGRPTAACRRSEALAQRLEALGLSVVFQREYLSTDEARRRAREAGMAADAPVDHLAAQVLLEEYLAGRRAHDLS
jgi:putative Holliday junction resolvase